MSCESATKLFGTLRIGSDLYNTFETANVKPSPGECQAAGNVWHDIARTQIVWVMQLNPYWIDNGVTTKLRKGSKMISLEEAQFSELKAWIMSNLNVPSKA